MSIKTPDEIKQEAVLYFQSKHPNSHIKDGGNLDFLLTVSSLNAYLQSLDIETTKRNIFPQTATEEALLQHALAKGIELRDARTSIIKVEFTGTEGSSVDAGSILKTSDLRVFKTLNRVTISSGLTTITVDAESELSGKAQNLSSGDILKLSSVIIGIDENNVKVISTVRDGEDIETIESLRERVINQWQDNTAGGTLWNYIRWAEGVIGIKKAYVYTGLPGQVKVFVKGKNIYKVSDAKLQEVKKALEYDDAGNKTRANLGINVLTVESVSIIELYIRASGLLNLSEIFRSQVKDALNKFIDTKEPYIDGHQIKDNSVISIGQITSVISNAIAVLGQDIINVELRRDSASSNQQEKISLAEGQIFQIRNIEYV